MPSLIRKTTPLTLEDVTLDAATSTEIEREEAGDGAAKPRCPAVCLVEGSGGELTAETACLLQGRLRLAAGVLLASCAIFLVRHLFLADFSDGFGLFFFAFHTVVTAALAAIALMLWRQCEARIGWLRGAELAVFGLPAGLFLLFQYALARESADVGFFQAPIGAWLVLIFTYALFIPNSLRRASGVIGLIAAAPVVMLLVTMATDAGLARLVTWDDLITLVLMLAISAVAAVFGVDTIGSLRRAAFEARQLGQYRLKEMIGAGGMGEVYLAEHQLLKRPCVVKLIRPDKAGDPRVLARFQREVQATARLTHWNTVEIFDYGVAEDGTFYYVMEYLPGMSLAELVDRYGPLPPARVIYLLRQACDALGEAHSAGLIHRDIKPGNIFAAHQGGVYDVAKLLDFGLVKPIVDDQALELTAEGAITGSPLFMSPEQAIGEREPDARSDIYSLGAVAYYLLTGRPPFEGEKPIKVMFAHAHQEVVPPSAHQPETPADIERTVLRCLAKDPDDRYPDAASLADALSDCEAAADWSRQAAARWWQQQRQFAVA